MNQHSELGIHDTGVIDILSVNDIPIGELLSPPDFHESVRGVHVNLYTDGFPSLFQYNPTAVTLRQEGVDLRSNDDPRAAIGLFRASIETEYNLFGPRPTSPLSQPEFGSCRRSCRLIRM